MKEENIFESCESIIHYLAKENDEGVRQLKYKDFLYKFNQIKTPPKFVSKTKRKVDIIIFTVIENEYKALKELFTINDEKMVNNKRLNGIKAWEVDIERSKNQNKLDALIVFIGKPGDLECLVTAMRIFQEYDCDLAVLCGIAAGLPEEIKKYSVIISEGIFDYENQRLEPGGKITYRPEPYSLNDNKKLLRDMQFLVTDSDSWRKYYDETVLKYENIYNSGFDIKQIEKTILKFGIIASGKKLFADSESLKILRNSIPFDKGIVAADMESAGFCKACNELSINWLVIRGISDYGGEDKNEPSNKEYQHIAAFGAFTALLYYLENNYKRETEDGGTMEKF
jgi:nucleoside phosphorylase